MVLHELRARMTLWRAAGPVPVLAAGLFLLPPLAILAPLGLAPLLFATALFAVAMTWPRLAPPPLFPFACLALLVVWALVGALWAMDPTYSAIRALRLAAEILAGGSLLSVVLSLGPGERQRVGLALCAGMALGIAFLLVEAVTGGALLAAARRPGPAAIELYKRGSSIIALFAWPAASVLFRRWGLAAALGGLALAGVAVLAHRSDSAILAYAIGGLVWLAATVRPAIALRALGVALLVAVLAAPLLPRGPLAPARILDAGIALPMSMMHRLVIWEFVASNVPSHLAGAGLDSSRAYPGGKTNVPIEAIDRRSGERSSVRLEALPLHPHNAALQIWLELGIPGIAIAIALVGWMIRQLLRSIALDRFTLATAAAGLGAALIVANLSYGLWQSWWIAALWLLAAATVLQLSPANRT